MSCEYERKLVRYAGAKRATAKKLYDKDFNESWAGRLKGTFVKLDDEFKKPTKEEALDVARRFRQRCKEEAIEKGLIVQKPSTGY